MSDHAPEWQKVDAFTVYENPWIAVSHHNVVNPAGGRGIYGVVSFKHRAVGVLAIDQAQRLVLVGQYRYPLGRFSWEIPEGGCRLGGYAGSSGPGNEEPETPEQCARRELAEETGLTCAELEPFLSMTLSNSITDEQAQVFLATGLQEIEPDASEPARQREPTEADMQVRRVELPDALQMIERGEIDDAISVAAIYKFVALFGAD